MVTRGPPSWSWHGLDSGGRRQRAEARGGRAGGGGGGGRASGAARAAAFSPRSWRGGPGCPAGALLGSALPGHALPAAVLRPAPGQVELAIAAPAIPRSPQGAAMEEQPALEEQPAEEQAAFEQGAPAPADGAPGEAGRRVAARRARPAPARRLPAAQAGRPLPRAPASPGGTPGRVARPKALQAPAAGASPPPTAPPPLAPRADVAPPAPAVCRGGRPGARWGARPSCRGAQGGGEGGGGRRRAGAGAALVRRGASASPSAGLLDSSAWVSWVSRRPACSKAWTAVRSHA